MPHDGMYPMSPRDRYHSDSAFRALVDMMTHMILQTQYSPSEMRDAAVLASIQYEYLTVDRRTIYVDSLGTASDKLVRS